jgi:LysM repeat protein
LNTTPCPWLLDPSGAITLTPSRTLSHCGAEPTRPELAKATRAERCIVGGACQIRQAREAQLGTLATSLAPRQPIGDAAVISSAALPRPSNGSPWLRVLLVVVLAGVITVASGPVAGVVGPIVTSIVGSLTTPSEATPTPSAEATPTASPSESPSPSPSPSESPSPSPSPSPSGSPAIPNTYVVRSGDTLSGIALSLNISMADLIALNGITDPNKIKPGQVLKLP